MGADTWLAFAVASAVLLAIPGPTILLVVSYVLGQGWRTAVPISAGVALGDFTAMTLSMLGAGALLATSAALFTALKWIGASYLIWLGIKLWRSGAEFNATPRTEKVSVARMIGHAWLVTALNPKSITFFVAFLPQFLNPAGDFIAQMAVLEGTFLTLAFANAMTYAFVTSRLCFFSQSPKAVSAANKTGGAMLIGAGLMATASHTARN